MRARRILPFSDRPTPRLPRDSSKKVSRAELKLARHMSKWNIHYRRQVPIETRGGTFIVDFVAGKNCVVECEGAVHSGTIAEDNRRESLIREVGFKVLRIPDFQIFGDVTECLRKIRECADSSATLG